MDEGCIPSLGLKHRDLISVLRRLGSAIYITLTIKTNICPFSLFSLFCCFSLLAKIHSYFGAFDNQNIRNKWVLKCYETAGFF